MKNDTNQRLASDVNKCPIVMPIIKPVAIVDVASPTRSPIKHPSGIMYDSIDLCTPPEKSPEIRRVHLADEMRNNPEFIRKLDQSSICGEVIDLTTDETQLVSAKSTSSSSSSADLAAVERSKVTIDTMLNTRPPSTATMTTKTAKSASTPVAPAAVNLPELPWKPVTTVDTGHSIVDVDSLSSSTPTSNSSTSSIEDIPHYVLESTTSPDTMPADAVHPNPRNASAAAAVAAAPVAVTSLQTTICNEHDDQLMQIDSLMIIDGQYVGDPEDLQHMQVPDGVRFANSSNQSVPKQRTVVAIELPPLIEPPLLPICSTFHPVATPALHPPASVLQQYRSSSSSRPELKFDTRNANKIDTLRNMPLIVPIISKPVKPTQLTLKPSIAEPAELNDLDKTPTAPIQSFTGNTIPQDALTPTPATTKRPAENLNQSDSETEDVTNAGLTETELSDWAADDAVSENFVEIEFALNSNKGTIRRNKKKKPHSQHHHEQKSLAHAATPEFSTHSKPALEAVSEPASKRCPLAKDLDMDEIEFMDTGSEDSCMETYSATNQAMLRNRGYVEFVANNKMDVDQTADRLMRLGVSAATRAQPFAASVDMYSYKSDAGYGSSPKDSLDRMAIEDDGKQRRGVDYIEQGACILGKQKIVCMFGGTHNYYNFFLTATATDLDSMRTPMNEIAPALFSARQATTVQPDSFLDIDDDSLAMLVSTRTTGTCTGTTTDSDALTIVTSTGESMTANLAIPASGQTTAPRRSDSGSDPTVATTTTVTTTATESPARADADNSSATNRSSLLRSSAMLDSASPLDLVPVLAVAPGDGIDRRDDGSYEDYVRKLQHKISQISNARDSIDIRKTKRRHSKGDPTLATTVPTPADVIAAVSALHAPIANSAKTVGALPIVGDANRSLSIFVNPQPQASVGDDHAPVTVGERIEEITKERTKQKDLIHDLVMDKLQSKKQLNAEKRLNRSRNRNSMIGGSGGGGGCGRSPMSAVAMPPDSSSTPSSGMVGTVDRNFELRSPTNKSPAQPFGQAPKPDMRSTHSESASNTYSVAKPTNGGGGASGRNSISPTKAIHKTPRPISEYFACNASVNATIHPAALNRLTKTQSFCVFDTALANTAREPTVQFIESMQGADFQTPVPPPRRNRADSVPSSASSAFLAEQLRQEARCRARLKSNHDLGLSPDEKLQLMRKRLQLDGSAATTVATSLGVEVTAVPAVGIVPSVPSGKRPLNKSDDMKVRERKMMASKSVNDIATVLGAMPTASAASAASASNQRLPLGAPSAGASVSTQGESSATAVLKRRSNLRAKDPERRKSIISYVSDLFHKKKPDSVAAAAAASGGVASGSGSAVSKTANDGMFGRFRISPKSKSKVRKK